MCSVATSQTISGTTFNQLIKEEVLSRNPASKVSMQKEESKREFLSFEEIQLLSATPKPNIYTCNAFLFSCFTGLRISDLRLRLRNQAANHFRQYGKHYKTG